MATDKNTIKSWFEKDDRPTQAQFWAWIDSIWHKDEKIPITAIDDIEAILNDKADADAFGNHLTDANAHAELFAEPNARLDDLEAKTDTENNWKTITGYSLNPATRVLTMDAGWEGIINGIEYTNVAAQEMLPAIPLANSGYSRIDLIVFKTDGTFERIPGVESTFTPIAPPKPDYTLEATFLTVGDGVVNVAVIPKPKAPVTSVNGMRGDVVLNAINDLVTGGIYNFLSAEQGKVLKTQIDNINILLASDNVNLDNVQELVDAIETVQLSLSTILVNDLTTGGTTKALTAEMGKTLKALIDGLVIAKATDAISGTVKTDVTKADPVVYTVETTDNLLKAKVNAILEIKPITGIAYTLLAYDTENLVQLAYDSTLPMTVTIPNNTTLPLPIGSIFYTVGSNTGALTIAGGSGVTFQTAVGLTAGQNETRKYVKKSANTWQVEGGAQPMAVGGAKTYKTYFVNSVSGNNATGVYEDSSKPFATIDYVLSLPFISGTVIYLQNEFGVFPMNGKFPLGATKITSDANVTLDFSANTIGNLFTTTDGMANFVQIDLKHGLLKNDRAGGASGCIWFETNIRGYLSLDVREIYLNTNNYWFLTMGMSLKVQKISSKSSFMNGTTLSYSGGTIIYDISHFVCLGDNATFLNDATDAIIRIAEITGSGSYYFAPNIRTEVGNIKTTNACSLLQNSMVHFNNSIITSANGLNVSNEENGNAGTVFLSGNIKSCPRIISGYAVSNLLKFTNFSGDFGAGYLTAGNGSIIFENCSIKSNGYLINIPSYITASKIILKNSTFEMVTPAPLITATAGANTHTIKIGNIATNATVINNQIGSGVTVTQFTNY